MASHASQPSSAAGSAASLSSPAAASESDDRAKAALARAASIRASLGAGRGARGAALLSPPAPGVLREKISTSGASCNLTNMAINAAGAAEIRDCLLERVRSRDF
jgi:hypothetical protein